MSHVLEGYYQLVKITATSVGAAATDAYLQASAGELWEIHYCFGKQDDGAVACYWLWTDETVTDEVIGNITGAQNAPFHLGAHNKEPSDIEHWYAPPIVTANKYFTFRFVASGAGKIGTIVAFVRKFRGVPSNL